MSTPPNLSSRIRGGMWGLIVGDALGVPFEFKSAAQIPAEGDIDFALPAGYRRSHDGTPLGTWSDDSAHALCLLASLLDRGRVDPDDLMRRLVDWHETGYLAVDGRVFDVGNQTSTALDAYRAGTPALECGPAEERANGNGSLMRVLPLALWHTGTDAELVRDAHLQSRVTHGHLRSQVCCALYCLWVRRLVDGSHDAWHDALAALRTVYGEDSPERAELDQYVHPDAPAEGGGSGYVVDTLHSARWAFERPAYQAVVRAAISLGNDTDTTAAVAEGVAGVRGGVEQIPAEWMKALRGVETATPLIEGLVELRAH